MPKTFGFLFVAVWAAAIGLIVGLRLENGAGAQGATPTLDAGPSDAGARDASASTAGGDAGDVPATAPSEDPMGDGHEIPQSDAGATLPNGTLAPTLGAEAPKAVVFGVILVTYKGAQGAPTNARPRDKAQEVATQLAGEAKTDFKAALAKGDKGSLENAGRMPRGMLEPAPEYVLFTLPKDGVSDPVDTPRGFWIIHRIE
jgi:hypothetical protein